MMENPFLMKNSYRYPQSMASSYPSQPSSRPKLKKVVSIPVHFVESDDSRSESALKIQKAFLGFRVRKNVKKIMAVRCEVDELEKKVEEKETMDFIKRDSKERTKLNESLMALLLKLDSVRGVEDGVRDLRKAVIRKAIMLQEKIDSFCDAIDDCVADNSPKIDEPTSANVGDEGETRVSMDDDAGTTTGNATSIDEFGANCYKSTDNTTDTANNEVQTLVAVNVDAGDSEKIAGRMIDSASNEGELRVENPNPENIDIETWDCVGEIDETTQKSDFDREENPNSTKRSNDDWLVVEGAKEDRKNSKEQLLGKMMEEQEMMMAMVADLCERNAAQANLISSLSNRVEQLEKAMNDREMRRRKKKNATLNGIVHP